MERLVVLAVFLVACELPHDPGASPSPDIATDAGMHTCVDGCSVGARRCAGTSIQTCRVMSSGCTAWSAAEACAGGWVCSGNRCVAGCTDQCVVDSRQCAGTSIQTCTVMASGCSDWDTPVACAGAHESCSGNRCVTTCSDQCTVGDKRCVGTSIQSCTLGASGCSDWDVPVACGGAYESCSGNQCVASCSDQCTVGDKRCAGTSIQSCTLGASGCSDWDVPVACGGAHESCSGNQCVASCNDQCTVGDKRCAGTSIQSCTLTASGCSDWDAPQACPQDNSCSGGACIPVTANRQCVSVPCSLYGVSDGLQVCLVTAASPSDSCDTYCATQGKSCSESQCFSSGYLPWTPYYASCAGGLAVSMPPSPIRCSTKFRDLVEGRSNIWISLSTYVSAANIYVQRIDCCCW